MSAFDDLMMFTRETEALVPRATAPYPPLL